ncbi:MAG: O-antigen ligase family protein, partial [Bacteroidota bacterium]
MGNTAPSPLASPKILHWILYSLLASTTLVVTINSFDSGIAKTPLLALHATLIVAVFTSQAIIRGRLEVRLSPADIPVLLLLLLIVISASYTQYTWHSQQALAAWIPFIVCFFVGTQLFNTQADVSNLLRALAVIGTVVCVVGFVQFFFAEELIVEFFIGKERRVTSTLTNAIYLSGYIVLLFPALLAYAAGKGRRPWERWWLGTLLGGFAFLLMATSTRGSLAAFVASLVLFGIMSRKQRSKPLIIAGAGVLLALAAALYLSPSLSQRIERVFGQETTSTLARRVYFWEAGYKAFRVAPLLGHGIGSYEVVMRDYRSPDYWIAK